MKDSIDAKYLSPKPNEIINLGVNHTFDITGATEGDWEVYGSAQIILMDRSGPHQLHLECINRCRSSVLSKCIERYPEALAKADDNGYLPLHLLLVNRSSTIEDALMMMEKYPTALQHQSNQGSLPLHFECFSRCRSIIISKCIELYPEAVAVVNNSSRLPLHELLINDVSSTEDALMMMEKYPAALAHQIEHELVPIHIEGMRRCR
jgi:hypothetical protein